MSNPISICNWKCLFRYISCKGLWWLTMLILSGVGQFVRCCNTVILKGTKYKRTNTHRFAVCSLPWSSPSPFSKQLSWDWTVSLSSINSLSCFSSWKRIDECTVHKDRWRNKQCSEDYRILETRECTFLICASFSFKASVWVVQTVEPGNFSSFSNLASSLWRCFTSALSDITTLTCAFVTTSFAQVANRRVFLDCSIWVWAGLIVQIMVVLALPPREDCNIRVSFESL